MDLFYDGTIYLTCFGSENYDAIYNRIRKLASFIFFALFCKKQSWYLRFFTYRRMIDFGYGYNMH